MAGRLRSRAPATLQAFRAILGSRWARLVAAGILLLVWVGLPIPPSSDAANLWQMDLADPYRNRWGAPDSFVYPPPIALLLAPLTELPFEVFYRLLLAANLIAMGWLVGLVGAAFALLLPPVLGELQVGNIHILIGAAIVLGFRTSAAWAMPILTKVTPAVGLLWFAVRREWRRLGVAVGATVGVVAVTWPFVGDLWPAWIELVRDAVPRAADLSFTVLRLPLVVRVVVASGIVIVAAWQGWRWAVPIAVLTALPAVWYTGLSMLLAVVPLLRPDQESPTVMGDSVPEGHFGPTPTDAE
jgi:hypothetical protein